MEVVQLDERDDLAQRAVIAVQRVQRAAGDLGAFGRVAVQVVAAVRAGSAKV